MTTPIQPTTLSIGSVDAQRVEDAFSLIAPKWTSWSAQTLAQQGHPMRVRDVATRLPFVSEQLVGKRLAQMHADGLVTRADDRHGAPYQLSAFGESLSRVHRALSDWSQTNLSIGNVAGAERVEDAVRRLHLRHSTAVIQVLDGGGPMRFIHIAEEAGLDNGFTRQRLNRLQVDGLVARTGPRHGDPYVLTGAGRALGPVYAAVEHWSNPVATRRHSSPPTAVTAATRTHTGVPLGSDGIRTAAALRRSTAAPSALFSHAPQPQPRVPAAVTAQSALSRGRGSAWH
ncbi:winged helix-turn-helix transcriptional regulator [Streptomyces sp. NPDC127040]|uniref:winged helix-turn-helix transcriptional regulator n=1 Tax=Streptomyces sp. NPDC127040 TaxID=3347116 RepID=UPI00365DB951